MFEKSLIFPRIFLYFTFLFTAYAIVLPNGYEIQENLLRINGRALPVCAKAGMSCADDCSTLMLCIGQSKAPFFTQDCRQSFDKPYCVNNACTASYPLDRPQCHKDKFLCTSDGFFPDPTDCRKFHFCMNYNDNTIECPPDHIFDSTAEGLCRYNEDPAYCPTFNCGLDNSGYVTYEPNPLYYGICLTMDTYKQIVVFKCGDNSTFDGQALSCVFNCISEGLFADSEDLSSYYSCARDPFSGTFVSVKLYCGDGEQFDGTSCSLLVANNATIP